MSYNLRALIREVIKKELEEVSTSAATPGFQTPGAFRGSGPAGKAKRDKNSTVGTGFDIVAGRDKDRQDDASEEKDPLRPRPMGESRYLEFRNDESLSPKQKIGRALTEINRSLDEIDRVVKMNARLKTEMNLEGTGLWKRTFNSLTKMEGKLMGISQRIRELKA